MTKKNLLFCDLYELYIQNCSLRLKENTLLTKKYIFSSRILPYFGSMEITCIKPLDIQLWQNHLATYNFSTSYLTLITQQLSSFFNFAILYEYLQTNPCRNLLKRSNTRKTGKTFWTLDEYKQFISSISNAPRLHCAFQLLFWGGLRVGELLALTAQDYDLNSKSLHITKSYQRLNKRDIITSPKNLSSYRTVTLPAFLAYELQHLFILSSTTFRLFPYTKYSLRRYMLHYCRISGIDYICIHNLRHSHASLLFELGFSHKLISERLGHKKVETTINIYSHLYPNKQVALAKQLDELN